MFMLLVLDGNHPQCLHMNVSYDIVRKWEAQCENDIDEEIELGKTLLRYFLLK